MTTLSTSALARLDTEGRLLNNVFKGATKKAGRYAFRGDIALKFAERRADEARPPETSCDQVIAVANEGEAHISFLTCFLLSFEHLKLLAEVLGDTLSPTGTYILFCDNIDLAEKYLVDFGGATFVVLPIDEATVYNETLELLYLEKTELKRLDGAGKIDAIANAAAGFKPNYPKISFEEGLQRMGPVRNLYENRPV